MAQWDLKFSKHRYGSGKTWITVAVRSGEKWYDIGEWPSEPSDEEIIRDLAQTLLRFDLPHDGSGGNHKKGKNIKILDVHIPYY